MANDRKFAYTDKEFNQMYITLMEECMQTMRERGAEYNNAAASTSMMTYFEGDEIIQNPFQVCYMYVKHKFERFKNCLSKYINQIEIGADSSLSYEKAEDSLKDLVNYAVFELVILRLHHEQVHTDDHMSLREVEEVH